MKTVPVLERKNVASFIKARFYWKRACVKMREHASKNVNKCQYFTRFYGFDDRYITEINMDLADVYLQNMKKDIDVAFFNFLVTNLCLTLSLIYIFYTCIFVF